MALYNFFKRLFGRKEPFEGLKEFEALGQEASELLNLVSAIQMGLDQTGYAGMWFASVEVAEEVFLILPKGEVVIHRIGIGPNRVEVDFLMPGFALAA